MKEREQLEARLSALADRAPPGGPAPGPPPKSDLPEPSRLYPRWTALLVGVLALGLLFGAALLGVAVGQHRATTARRSEARRAVEQLGLQLAHLDEWLARGLSLTEEACLRARVRCDPSSTEPLPPLEPNAPRTTLGLVAWAESDCGSFLSPAAFAGPLRELRPDASRALASTYASLTLTCRLAREHAARLSRAQEQIEVSLRDASAASEAAARSVVVVQRLRTGPAGAPPQFAAVVVRVAEARQDGLTIIAPEGVNLPVQRSFYEGGDLSSPLLHDRVAIPVLGGVGVLGSAVATLGTPWAEYAAELRELSRALRALQTEHAHLAHALTWSGP